jgi:putative ATP-dependent endonuclease of OLD family
MRIKTVRIRNFRSILDAEIDFADTTVLIGPNNSGKTAILDAIRIALTRRWGQRGTGFTEYDVHLNESRTDPKTGDPVTVEILIEEDAPDEWGEDIQAALADIIVVDVHSGLSAILLRVTCAWDDVEQSYMPRWEFLNVERVALSGKGARAINLSEFFEFLPVFYLEALRDASDEYSSKSQFWGKLLRTVQIPEDLEKRSKRIFDLLNKKLLDSDARLSNLASEISTISKVATCDGVGEADLRILPLNTWDILSKAEVIYKTKDEKPWLPLVRHGQGVQSLSVIFLFKSFVELVLKEIYRQESSPVLALEEPETHLHPQAARSLWSHVNALGGQKIVTTHSPYFLQFVPFRDIRVVRESARGTIVSVLRRDCRVKMADEPKLLEIVDRNPTIFAFDKSKGELIAKGNFDVRIFRKMSVALSGNAQATLWIKNLKELSDATKMIVSDEELEQLETFSKRIRGEIFFANRWLLVEGQSEFHLVHSMAKALGYGFDEQGISVIDFQNNGNPAIFASLARSFGYPWLMVVDGDDAGTKYLQSLVPRGFTPTEIQHRTFQLSEKNLEHQLLRDGLRDELISVMKSLGRTDAETLTDDELAVALENCKGSYAARLGQMIEDDGSLAQRMPVAFRDAIQRLRGLI